MASHRNDAVKGVTVSNAVRDEGTIVDDLPPPSRDRRGGRPMKYPKMAELKPGQSLMLKGLSDKEVLQLRSLASSTKGRKYSVARLLDGAVQVYRVE
jgi:hypothetical protein